jgi:hypothetical protein
MNKFRSLYSIRLSMSKRNSSPKIFLEILKVSSFEKDDTFNISKNIACFFILLEEATHKANIHLHFCHIYEYHAQCSN